MNKAKIAAHMALVKEYAEGLDTFGAVEASARSLIADVLDEKEELLKELNRLKGIKQVPKLLKKQPCHDFGRCNCTKDCQIG